MHRPVAGGGQCGGIPLLLCAVLRCIGATLSLSDYFVSYTSGSIGPCPDNNLVCQTLACSSSGCGLGGQCVDGHCYCLLGYDGAGCETDLLGDTLGQAAAATTTTFTPSKWVQVVQVRGGARESR